MNIKTLIVSICLLLVVVGATLIIEKQRGAQNNSPAVSTTTPPFTGALLIGSNYANYKVIENPPSCTLTSGYGIIYEYNEPGVRTTVQQQLATMHADGVQVLRTVIWYSTDPSKVPGNLGVLLATQAGITEPYATNLQEFASDIKAAGFTRWVVTFGAQGINDPKSAPYDPSTMATNWAFIASVRPIVKQYGPAQTLFDLENEIGRSDTSSAATQMASANYTEYLWKNYVNTFGSSDATFSDITPRTAGQVKDNRLQNLINAIAATKLPQPAWFAVHPGYTYDQVLLGLQNTDAVLSQNNLTQPLAIDETAYESTDVVAAIKEFESESSRPIIEVMDWPTYSNIPCGYSVSPPYNVDDFKTLL